MLELPEDVGARSSQELVVEGFLYLQFIAGGKLRFVFVVSGAEESGTALSGDHFLPAWAFDVLYPGLEAFDGRSEVILVVMVGGEKGGLLLREALVLGTAECELLLHGESVGTADDMGRADIWLHCILLFRNMQFACSRSSRK